VISQFYYVGLLVLAMLGGGGQPLCAQTATDSIRLNQVGFYPGGAKLAVVLGAKGGKFTVTTSDRRTTVFTGTLRRARAGQLVSTADFSGFKTPGTFVVNVPGTGVSYPFQIGKEVHAPLARAALKSYYYQRASMALPARYAGQWSRPAGHPDNHVLVHPSAATAQRPAGMVIAAPRGWYDAGDYNKYVVNSGITLGTLLSLYEDFPEYCATLALESALDAGDAGPQRRRRLPQAHQRRFRWHGDAHRGAYAPVRGAKKHGRNPRFCGRYGAVQPHCSQI